MGKGDHQPADQSHILPPPSFRFASVDFPAEDSLYGLSCKWNLAFSLKSIFKNQKGILRKVLYIGSGLRIKCLNQFFKLCFYFSSKWYSYHFLYKLGKRLLFFFLESLLVKEPLSFSMAERLLESPPSESPPQSQALIREMNYSYLWGWIPKSLSSQSLRFDLPAINHQKFEGPQFVRKSGSILFGQLFYQYG